MRTETYSKMKSLAKYIKLRKQVRLIIFSVQSDDYLYNILLNRVIVYSGEIEYFVKRLKYAEYLHTIKAYKGIQKQSKNIERKYKRDLQRSFK